MFLTRRDFLALMGVSGAALALAACGTSNDTAASDTSAAAETAAPAAQETAAQEEPAAAEEAAKPAEEAVDPNGTHEVTDHLGNTVSVPNKVTRVVIDTIPILSTYMSYFGGSAPYIVGYCGSFKQIISETVLKDIAPELLESTDTVYAQTDFNIEEIMKLEPDVVLYAGTAEHKELLDKAGIPCVAFPTMGAGCDPLTRVQEWLKQLEQVFGEEGKMDDFCAAGDAIATDVKARIAEIPEEARPTALIFWRYVNGTPMLGGQNTFGWYWMNNIGVKDVAAEMTGTGQVNMEQIISWNPEVLYLDGPGLLSFSCDEVYSNTVDGLDFSSIQAVKDHRVYNTKLGMWNWYTPNPDAPLVLAWLACVTYPEQFADFDLNETIRSYYSTWYNYELSDEELDDMLEY